MAEDFQDKSEEASGKKLEDARNKGQVAKSQDLTAVVVLLSGMVALIAFATPLYQAMENLMVGIFNNLNEPFDSMTSVIFWFQQGMRFMVTTMISFLGVVFFAALLINVWQVKLRISTYSLIPKWKNINIFDPSLYKKFFSLQAVMRLFFGLSKIAVVTVVGHLLILHRLTEISRLAHANPKEILAFLAMMTAILGVVTAVILFILGAMDFMYQKWKFSNDMKMTKQEVKGERKQTEGDMHMKSKVRSMMHSFSQNRMKANVPKSDVVIANPVHYAIAVKYDAETMAAPVCMAKGARRIAIHIKEIAKENGVPIVENPILARGLYQVVEMGRPIPPHFYHAVAEVLAYVYRLNEKMGKKTKKSKNKFLRPYREIRKTPEAIVDHTTVATTPVNP